MAMNVNTIPLAQCRVGKINYTSEEYHSSSSSEQLPNLKRHIGFRSLTAFWLLGLCNNYGYVVMLSAAHDILSRHVNNEIEIPLTNAPLNSPTEALPEYFNHTNSRDCNEMTTGAILLADIVPSLVIKIIAPFFPLCVNVRMALVVLLSVAGYVLVGASVSEPMAISGVVLTALSSGLGEATILSFLAFYKDKGVISSWSSGTGGAGFFGSLSYAFLIFLGLSPAQTLYLLTSIPLLMGITFWIILKHPKLNESSEPRNVDNTEAIENETETNHESSITHRYSDHVPLETTRDTFLEKLNYMPKLLKYMIPIGLVYLFEYFINQGLLELVYFRSIWLTHAEQYRWYQVLYQVGVFISRSSINFIRINRLWLLGLFQFINAVFFVGQSIRSLIPNIYVIMAIVLWEGLLGGAAYVNTYHKISNEVPPNKREFSMAITSLADAIGITVAGFLAFPVHNYICHLPLNN